MSEDTEDQNNEEATDDWAEAFAEQELAEQDSADELIAEAEAASLPNLNSSGVKPASEDVNMDVILDIPVTIQMEIGRTKVNIRNLLQLNQGSVVELDRLAGEPLDVLVNNTLIAHGEVVVVNEKYGIRLTDVISPAERVQKLK
ncbi:MAG TPA: flagellar motor switch protein FliN [Ectothiorhodospiraceae bacterium]|nr:flagellar motor switch protein FliN [Ectothiorhodospiraceae bacterium]